MLTGLLLILAGFFVWFHPRILVLALASFLVFSGLGIIFFSWKFRRARRNWEQSNAPQWTRFFIRF